MSDDPIGSCVTLSKLFLSVRFYSKVRISKGTLALGLNVGTCVGTAGTVPVPDSAAASAAALMKLSLLLFHSSGTLRTA